MGKVPLYVTRKHGTSAGSKCYAKLQLPLRAAFAALKAVLCGHRAQNDPTTPNVAGLADLKLRTPDFSSEERWGLLISRPQPPLVAFR